MGEYTLGIERINIELSLRNKLALLDELEGFLAASPLPLGKSEDTQNIPTAEILGDRVARALALLGEVRALWQGWMSGLDIVQPAVGDEPARTFFERIQDVTLRASWKTQVLAPLQQIFAGAEFLAVIEECRRIHKQVLRGRTWVALHMS